MELLILMAILGLVMAGLLGFLTASRNANTRGSSTVDLEQNLRVASIAWARQDRRGGKPSEPRDMSSTCLPGAGGAFYLNRGGTNESMPGSLIPSSAKSSLC